MERHIAIVIVISIILSLFALAPSPAFACHETIVSTDPLVNWVCEEAAHPPVDEEIQRLKDLASNVVFFVFCTLFPDHPACQA